MKLREEETKLQELLKETITLLCKNGLQFSKGFSIDALIGITTDDASTFLVKLEETVSHDDVCDNTEGEKSDVCSNVDRGSSRSLRKRPPGDDTGSSSSKRHRSDDDDSNDAAHSNNEANADSYDDTTKDKCAETLLIKQEENDEDPVRVKQELFVDDGPFAFAEQSLVDDTAPDDTAPDDTAPDDTAPGDTTADGSSFDGGSHDDSSTLNQSSATNDPEAAESQQVRELFPISADEFLRHSADLTNSLANIREVTNII